MSVSPETSLNAATQHTQSIVACVKVPANVLDPVTKRYSVADWSVIMFAAVQPLPTVQAPGLYSPAPETAKPFAAAVVILPLEGVVLDP